MECKRERLRLACATDRALEASTAGDGKLPIQNPSRYQVAVEEQQRQQGGKRACLQLKWSFSCQAAVQESAQRQINKAQKQ
eukprot:scaffold167552_cov20-Tisochrysis_lutea.AAC.1